MRYTPLAAIAACIVIGTPLTAQQTNAIPATSARVVASYDFRTASTRTSSFPLNVTVADSAGTIVAYVDLGDSQRSVPMTVTVIERNLVLQGQTPDGVLTLVLDRQNEGGVTKLASGTWTLGTAQGQLRGRVQP